MIICTKFLALNFPFSRPRMKASRSKREDREKRHHPQQRGYRAALCCSCSCRLSVSSSEEAGSCSSERFASISSLAHAMVQERLDLMIRERQEARHAERERRRQRSGVTKFVVMVAMQKSSDDPREDFRESMMEMITANRIEDPKDLRSLLNYYVSMNGEECYSIILEVFYDVCTDLFLSRKCR